MMEIEVVPREVKPPPPFLSGVLEGFYGRPWSVQQRHELIQNMSRWKLNTYMYAPKDDKKHRAAWRDLYDATEVPLLSDLISVCKANGINFVYACAPGLDIRYSETREIEELQRKYQQVADLGCTHFAVLFDDIPRQMQEPDKQAFGSFAAAQAHVANALFSFLREKVGESVRLLFCPTDYCKTFTQKSTVDYVCEIGRLLSPEIDVLWTGDDIISLEVSEESVRWAQQHFRRNPILWDNIHANDYDIRRVYLGPYEGRSQEAKEGLAGILLNPNCEYAANFIPFRTLALYVGSTPEDPYFAEEALSIALPEWLPQFHSLPSLSAGVDSPHSSSSHTGVTLEDLSLLVDLSYLPHKHGARGKDLLKEFTWLLKNDPALHNWKQRKTNFDKLCRRVAALYDKMTEINNRDLLYSLYGYLWELKEEMLLLLAYMDWRAAGNRHETGDWRAKVYRGGLVADLQRLLPMSEDASFRATFAEPKADCFVIRSYQPSDEDAVYEVCLKTGNAGSDGTRFYEDHKVLGHRYVGPYINLQPELAFVLEDDQGVCGYVLGALDSQAFYLEYQEQWLPAMRRLYPQDTPVAFGKRDGDIINLFYTPDTYFPDHFSPYPSHLHIDLLPRAQGRGLGVKMIKRLLDELTKSGSRGVHLCMAPSNTRALHFYTKLGFSELERKPEDLWLAKELTRI